jgi:hypothetical protein
MSDNARSAYAADPVWLDLGGWPLRERLRISWRVLTQRPTELAKRHPASDTVFPVAKPKGGASS